MKILNEKLARRLDYLLPENALRVLSKTDPKYFRLEIEELIDDRVAATSAIST